MNSEDNFFGENPDPRMENMERLKAERAYWRKRDREIAKAKKGQLEGQLQKDFEKGISQKKKGAHVSRYNAFYKEGENISLEIGDQVDYKKELLIKYFPSRFSDKGNQPITKKDDLQIGAIFKKLMEFAEKYKD